MTMSKSLEYRSKNDVAIFDKFDTNRLCLFSFKELVFANKLFTLMFRYRKQFPMLQYLLTTAHKCYSKGL